MLYNRCSSVDWKPSSVLALATSVDDSQVAAAREDGSLEIWLVSPGSVGWHCQITIHGDPNSRVSSLVWCKSGLGGPSSGRLFSSSIDGSLSEWDLFDLRQKTVLDSIGVSIWQMAAEPSQKPELHKNQNSGTRENGHANNMINGGTDDGSSASDSDDDDDDSMVLHEEVAFHNTRLAVACDDGCVRIYNVSGTDKPTYYRSLPRVSGRTLSVIWSPDASRIYSGSSDGFIRCWDAKSAQEIYRITVGLGGLGSGPELCLWSLLALRCGTLVSADSTGSVQFWDSQHGTLQQAYSSHNGDVNALAAAPSHNRVFSAGSDGQVILYKLSSNTVDSDEGKTSTEVKKTWVNVGYVRAHSHDVRALIIAVPISQEDASPEKKLVKSRGREKPLESSYHKWAHLGIPMLISAGDDTKLFAYSVREFTKFSPHDICPAPQRIPMQLVHTSSSDQNPLLLVQSPNWLDIISVRVKEGGGRATTDQVARVRCIVSRKIICSAMSSSGRFFAYSDHVKPSLFELKKKNATQQKKSKRNKASKHSWIVKKRQWSLELPYAHCMVFSSDSSRLLIAGYDRKIYVVDIGSEELVHAFTPCRKEHAAEGLPPTEPPITKLFTSIDGQWLAAVNCFGDVYIFNLELQRQHWFISRLDNASVTAGGFHPKNSNVLILSTSSNHVYGFDVEKKQLGKWSVNHTYCLPRRFQEFPGEVIGLSFPPSSSSLTVIVYSPRAMCFIDFEMPVDGGDSADSENVPGLKKIKLQNGLFDLRMPEGFDDSAFANGQELKLIQRLKRKYKEACETETREAGPRNFKFCYFEDPVLFVGHLSNNSLLIMEKPWAEVVRTFDAPVHRHVYGT